MLWNVYSFFYDNLNKLIPYKNMMKEIYGYLDLKENDRILDAGCGTGNTIKFISEKNNNQIIGIDSNQHMLNKAKNKLVDNLNVELMNMDLNKQLQFKSNSFDKIILINVLYAVNSPEHVLKELYRVLKPSGKLIIVNPINNPKNINIYYDHCRSTKSKINNIKTFFSLFIVGLLNILIIRKGNKKVYHFLKRKDYKSLMKNFGYKNILVKLTYSEQAFMVAANK